MTNSQNALRKLSIGCSWASIWVSLKIEDAPNKECVARVGLSMHLLSQEWTVIVPNLQDSWSVHFLASSGRQDRLRFIWQLSLDTVKLPESTAGNA